MSSKKIQSTKNYRLFNSHSPENRPLNLKKHKKLMESMKLYGFLECFPIVCTRDKNGTLVVKDGQHRLAIAETLALPVHWVEEKVDFDVAVVNCSQKTWQTRDYAEKHAANGLMAYQEGLEFTDQHGLQVGVAFAMLAGTTSFTNCQSQFVNGTFKVKDRAWADSVAGLYGPMVLMADALRSSRFLEACMAVCRVKELDPKRLLANTEKCREKLVNYSTRDAYLEMLDVIYNYGRRQLVPLKHLATMAMRERNFAPKAKNPTAKDNAAA